MKIITRATLAAQAAPKWMKQYYQPNRGWTNPRDRDSKAIHDQLVTLGATPDPDAVDAIIGNTSWTMVPRCDECDTLGHALVLQVGEEPGYESSTANLCWACVVKTFELVSK